MNSPPPRSPASCRREGIFISGSPHPGALPGLCIILQLREASMAAPGLPPPNDLAAYLGRLGERVRTVRSRRAMSRKALAKHSDVSERYLAQLEGGTGNCSVVLLRRIARALSVPVAELIDDRPERSIENLLVMQLIDRLAPAQVAEARNFLLSRF